MSKQILRATSILTSVAVIGWLLVPSLISPSAQETKTCRAGQYNFTKTLYKGMKDPQVADLQEMLAYCESSDIYPEKIVSGYYGALTEAAVKRFQKKYGISQVGVFGPVTRAKANELYGAGAQAGAGQGQGAAQNQALITLLQQLAQGNPSLQALLPLLAQLLQQQGQQAGQVPTGNISVSLASDNPTGGTLIETQSGATLLKFVVSNGTQNEATISAIKLKRTGVSSDYTLKNVYLYADGKRISDPASVTQNYANFTGLNVKIPAGSSVVFSVVADVAGGTSGQTIGFSLVSASDIVGPNVSGNFPLNGFNFQIASKPTDLASISFSGTTMPSTGNVNAGSMNYTVFRDQIQVNNREVVFKGLRLRMIGSISKNDLQNLILYIDGQQVANGSWEGENYVSFVPSSPLTLKTGNRNFEVRADIVGGSTRQFSFSLRYPSDLDIIDSQYNVGVEISGTPRTTGTLTIQGGSLTVQKLPLDSTYVVKDSRQVIGKFELQAYGEPVKIETLKLQVSGGSGLSSLRNGAIYVNGSQVGPTLNISASSATEFNNLNFVVYPGTKTTLEVWADIADPTSSTQPAINSNISLVLKAGTNNAQATQSLNILGVPASDTSGDTLSVVTGAATIVKNSAYGNQTFVRGKSGAKIASFVVSASQHEKLTVTSFQLQISTSTAYRNLRTNINTSDVRVIPASSENFSLNLDVPKGSQKVIDVYADILTSAPTGTPIVSTATVTYITESGYSNSATISGQSVTVAESGTLTFALHSDTPVSRYMVTGESSAEFLRFKAKADQNEDIKIEEVEVMITTTKPGFFYNITLSGDGITPVTKTAWENTGSATSSVRFVGLDFRVPANQEKIFYVKTNIALQSSVNLNTPATATIAVKEIKYRGVDSNVLVTTSTLALSGNLMTVYRGNLEVKLQKPSGASSIPDFNNLAVLSLKPIIYESGVNSVKLATTTFTLSGNGITTSTNTVLEVWDGSTLIATSGQVSWNDGDTSKNYVVNFNNREISSLKNLTIKITSINKKSNPGGYDINLILNSLEFDDGIASGIPLDPFINPSTNLTITYSYNQ